MSNTEPSYPAAAAGEQTPPLGVDVHEMPTEQLGKPLFQDEVDQDSTAVLDVIPDAPATLPDETETSGSRFGIGAKIGASVALVALGAGAALGVNKLTSKHDSDPTAPNAKPVATAPVTPSASSAPSESASPTPTQSPSEVSKPTPASHQEQMNDDELATYISGLDRDPSQQAIDYSVEPVAVGSYTTEEAVTRLMNDWKIYWLSGKTSQSSDISQKLTPETVALGGQELNNIFGPEDAQGESDLVWEWITETREYLTLNMGYLTKENGYPEDGILSNDFDILSEKDLGDGKIEFLVRNTWRSNMSDLDSSIANRDIDSAEFSTDRYITISQFNGNYIIQNIVSRAAVATE